MKLALGCSLALAFAAAACAAPAGDGGDDNAAAASASVDALDVNDVSVLFPLGPDGLPRPNLRVDDAAAPLITASVFKSITDFAQEGSEEVLGQHPHVAFPPGALDRSNWRIVAMRIEPCAPGALALGFSDPRCVSEIKMVAQPFVNGRAQDVAFHLVYNVGFLVGDGGKTMADMANDLKAIKRASGGTTTGQPLGVHPGLAAEAKQGGSDVGKLVASFITKYTARAQDISIGGNVFSPARLVAMMVKDGDYTTPADAPEWYFMAGEVHGSAWVVSELKPVGPGVKFEKLSFKQAQDGTFSALDNGATASVRGHFLPTIHQTSAPTAIELFDGLPDRFAIQGSTIGDIEAPHKSTVPTVDCASCHSSTSRNIGLGPNPDARVSSHAGYTAVVRRENLQTSVANTRNFGYFDGKPSISMRTLNETVEVAAYLNDTVLKVSGPSSVVVDDHLWTCCMNGGGAGCESTVCATPTLARRKVQLEANGAGGNPCQPDTSNADNDPRTAIDVSADLKSATLHGNSAACLVLSMNGNFFSDAVDIDCSMLDTCTVKLKSAPLTGDTATRLKNTLFLTEDGASYSATGADHSVAIACDTGCKVTIK